MTERDATGRRVVIFGNSGSGKSTLARALSTADGLPHLDLDSVAWLPTAPPERRPLPESRRDIEAFARNSGKWVIEGCYADLLEIALPLATELVFLNLSVEDCIANAKKRPWEPHKYSSPAAQDANLQMLIEWISRYPERDDTFSQAAHERLYNDYPGRKVMYTTNARTARPALGPGRTHHDDSPGESP